MGSGILLVGTGPREYEQEVLSLFACRGHPKVVKLVEMFADSTRVDDGDSFVATKLAGPRNPRQFMQLRRNK
ncbi:hypothetical protein EJB05_27941, partial [Eragrostis curvula]